MKKLLGISVMAMLAVSPMMASAASTPVTLMTAPGQAEQTAGGTTVPTVEGNQQIATTSYVTGAYNVLGAAHNALNNRVDTLEANTTLTDTEVAGHAALTSATDVAANLVGLATAIEGLNTDSTVEDGAYIKNDNKVTENLGALDTAAEQNSNAIAAILASNIPVYGTWNNTTPSNVTVGSLQGQTHVAPAESTRPANQGGE